MIHLHGNVLAALDVETSGFEWGYYDLLQVCVLPLDPNLDPMDVSPFYMNLRPVYPERAHPEAMAVNKLDLEELSGCPSPTQVADCFYDWFRGLNLGIGKRLIPLTQNAPFDIPWMKEWLGESGFGSCFSRRGRDTMFYASGINDEAAWANKPIPFQKLGLKDLCKHFGIPLDNHHDSLADCIATAKVYRELLRFEQ